MYESLLQPGKIGNLELKNRFVMTPANLSYCTKEGNVTPRLIEFYKKRAAGGVGLMVVGAVGVDPLRVTTAGVMQLSSDSNMPGMKDLVDAIHEAGGKVFPQLWHAGAYSNPVVYNGETPVAPSEFFCGFSRSKTRALEIEEIEEIIKNFADAAKRAKDVGFDGVELVGSAGYLIAQFLSSATNFRTDKYGGFLDGRMTFLREIFQAVRNAVGPDYPIAVRLAGNDYVRNGNDNDDCIRVAKELEKLGVDALNITGGWHETPVPQVTMDVPNGAYAYLAKRVKEQVSVPVYACNRMNFETASAILDRGDADFIGFCRAFIADPEMVNKMAVGHPELVRQCVGCNQGCMDNIFANAPLCCLANSDAGREMDENNHTPEPTLVIGAGVAGMEYALRAAKAGSTVTVWERKSTFGGQMDMVAAAPGREAFAELPVNQYEECLDAGVSFQFNKEAIAEEINAAVVSGYFKRVVIATGAAPIIPKFPTEEGANVVSAWDVLRGKVNTGKNVVVVGGGAVGVETALMLAEEGTISAEVLKFLMLYKAETPERLYELITQGSKKVAIVEMQKKIGADIGASTKWIFMSNLSRFKVWRHTNSKVVSIQKDSVTVENTEDGTTKNIPADTVVLAIGSRPENDLAEKLKTMIPNVLVQIGDSSKPRKAMDAIADAREAVMKA